jgi:hypothetical protein
MGSLRTEAVTISDQALFLLDDCFGHDRRTRLDIFSQLEAFVSSSLNGTIQAPATAEIPTSTLSTFTVAARLNRTNYDDQARAEALLAALQKIRNRKSPFQSGRVIRSN